MKFEIKHRWSGSVLFETEAETQREAILKAVKSGADLTDADLTRANLAGANLTRADLTRANLTGADLTGADLTRANLTRANLTEADLTCANLAGADLTDANLTCANLTRANLTEADLTDANLTDAKLTCADLAGANLTRANLTRADLTRANLTPIRDDFFAVLSCAPREVSALRQALTNGKVNGSTYHGECACLVGTIANAQHVNHLSIPGLAPNPDRPSERFFLAIREGDTPETNQFSALAMEWLDQWVANMESAFGK